MTAFARRNLDAIEPLGKKLTRLRTEAGLSVAEVAAQAHIPEKYCHALEESAYAKLPGEVYVRNFLKSYAQLLHLNVEQVLELYAQERKVVRSVGPAPTPPQPRREIRSVNIPHLSRIIAIIVVVVVLLVYLGLKVRSITTPPELTVTAPAADLVTDSYSVTVEGFTVPEAHVTINGQEILLDEQGRFAERVDLQNGLNVIKIAARKERSREQVTYRQVIVEVPPPGP